MPKLDYFLHVWLAAFVWKKYPLTPKWIKAEHVSGIPLKFNIPSMFSSCSSSFEPLLCGFTYAFSLDARLYCLFTFWFSVCHFWKLAFPLLLLLLKLKVWMCSLWSSHLPLEFRCFATGDKWCNITHGRLYVLSTLSCQSSSMQFASFVKILHVYLFCVSHHDCKFIYSLFLYAHTNQPIYCVHAADEWLWFVVLRFVRRGSLSSSSATALMTSCVSVLQVST